MSITRPISQDDAMRVARLGGVDLDYFASLAAQLGADQDAEEPDYQEAPDALSDGVRTSEEDALTYWASHPNSVLLIPSSFNSHLRIPGLFGVRFTTAFPAVARKATHVFKEQQHLEVLEQHLLLKDERVLLFSLPPDSRGTKDGEERACRALRHCFKEVSVITKSFETIVVPSLGDVAYALPHLAICHAALEWDIDPRFLFCHGHALN